MIKVLNKYNENNVCALGAIYNGEKPIYFEKCLDSLANQSLKLKIFLVIDGPISNELESILKKYESLKIMLIRNKENKGLAYALQTGLNYLRDKYNYAIRFDSDDIHHPNRFKKLIDYINEYEPDVISSHMNEIDEDGKTFSKRMIPVKQKDIMKTLPYRNPVNHASSAINIKKILDAGGYIDMPFFEDWYLWIRVIKNGGVVMNINETLVDFRATDDMVARRFGFKYAKLEFKFFYNRHKEKLINPLSNWLAFFIRVIPKLFGFRFYKSIFYLIRK